ncbi:unnamed protein product [Dovyalis caffra]|uniref:Polygalacturonase n=1 Tax=Dovyalis caffra TaxID=77055 RepID=A0AAV1QW10_9ROSI|nr:unnamed protein product [Dovyalis caffra]
MAIPLLITLLFISFASSPLAKAAQYSVLSYGAKPDGKTDSTKAFAAAWSQACASTQPATISVPKGSFSLGQLRFQGPCRNNAILLRIDGTLVAPSKYGVIGNANNWLMFEQVNGVTISGGTLDGQGAGLWSCKNSGKDCPNGATNYCPGGKNCPGQVSGVKISDVTYQDIHGSSATEVAVKFDCSKKYPCTGIKLEDVKLSYKNQQAEASCSNVGGAASGLVQPNSCLKT